MSFAAQAAGVIGKAVGAVGGPQVMTVLIVAGLGAGVVLGFLGNEAFGEPTGTPAKELPIVSCFSGGHEVAKAPAGQRMLITGVTQDRTFYRVHGPVPGLVNGEGYVLADAVTLEGPPDGLPVVTTCATLAAAIVGSPEALTEIQNNSPSPGPTPSPSPSASPVATPTAAPTTTVTLPPGATPRPPTPRPPTPKPPTPPPPTPPPTPTPPPADTTAPTINSLTRDQSLVYDRTNCFPGSVTFTANVTDSGTGGGPASGVAAVTLRYRHVGTGNSATVGMSPGSARSTWVVTILGSTLNDLGYDTFTFEVTAADKAGNVRPYTRFQGTNVIVAFCIT